MRRLYVDDLFHKKIKRIAADEDCSILELTKKLANDGTDDLKNQKIKPKKIAGGKFDFKF